MISVRHLNDASQVAFEIETTAPTSLLQSNYIPPSGPLTEAGIRVTPMDECHVELAVLHFRRLSKMVCHFDEDSVAPNVRKRSAAREQLARMTVVVRDYMDRRAQQNFTAPCVESMITDLCEASLYGFSIDGARTRSLVFANPTLCGREQEIETQKQALRAAGSADDVTELGGYTFAVSIDIVPEDPSRARAREDIAEGIDWNSVLVRSRSEDNIMATRHIGLGGVVKKERIQRKLLRTNQSSHLIHWPPVVVPFDGDTKLPGP